MIKFIRNLIERIKFFLFYNQYTIIISYLPFFENKNNDFDHYYVHIRVGWMEWVVYKYEYDIILDKYILAYLAFLYFQFLVMLPFYYLYVIKYKYQLVMTFPDLPYVIFFQRFNVIINIFVFIDTIILISFYAVWPMSALAHSLFFKVLNKANFAWAIILFLFFYELNLTIIAIFAAKFTWRQMVVVFTQFTIFNIFIYILWLSYHEFYAVKIAFLVFVQCWHAYCINGWNYWYEEIDFEDIWRLGPDMEGYVYQHEWHEARAIRKAKIDKIYDYEKEQYLARKIVREEEVKKRKEEKQKLRDEGKLSWWIIIKDDFFSFLYKIYYYFMYYDRDLIIKAEYDRAEVYRIAVTADNYKEDLINRYMAALPAYFQRMPKDHLNFIKLTLENDLNSLTKDGVNPFIRFQSIEEFEKNLFRILQYAHYLHTKYSVIDKMPMTFTEFLASFENKENLIKNRRRLVDQDEAKRVREMFEKEDKKTYEELMTFDPEENLTFLGSNIRLITLLKKFRVRFEKDKHKWESAYAWLSGGVYDIITEELHVQKEKLKEERRKKNKENNITDYDDNAEPEPISKYKQPPLTIKKTDEPITISRILPSYNMMGFIWDQKEYEEKFMDYVSEEEKRAREERFNSLWTHTFKKFKQMEEEDDYFKYTNIQKFLWHHDMHFHILGMYMYYWIFSCNLCWSWSAIL